MTVRSSIMAGIKARLRTLGLTYRDLATSLGVSEPTIKRDLSRGDFSLSRLERICAVLEVDLLELTQSVESAPLTQLSDQQERTMVDDPRLLLLTYLLVNNWKVTDIKSAFRFDENEFIRLLLKLDALRVIDFRPPMRIKRLTARNFGWRKDGPVHEYFIRKVVPEFFGARFDQTGDDFHFVRATLTTASMVQLQSSLKRVVAEFEHLAQKDSLLPVDQRESCSAILALRAWEFSEFSRWRRQPATKTAARR